MLADYTRLADGDGKGCYEKTGIYSARLKGVSAMAVFDSQPGSGHSAVAVETAKEPQKGIACLLAVQSRKCIQGQQEWEAVGADLYSVMISWDVRHNCTHTHTICKQIRASLWSVYQKGLFKDHIMCKEASSTIRLYVKHTKFQP